MVNNRAHPFSNHFPCIFFFKPLHIFVTVFLFRLNGGATKDKLYSTLWVFCLIYCVRTLIPSLWIIAVSNEVSCSYGCSTTLSVSYKDFTPHSWQAPNKYPAISMNRNKQQQQKSNVFVTDWRTQYYCYIVFSLEVELDFCCCTAGTENIIQVEVKGWLW